MPKPPAPRTPAPPVRGNPSTPNLLPQYYDQVEKLALLGATNEDIAEFFGVSTQTLSNWMRKDADFAEHVRRGKLEADGNVASRLYARAMGYEHEDEHIAVVNGEVVKTATVRRYPPDATSMIFWLKNRAPNQWRDRQEHTGAGGGPIALTVSPGDATLL